MIKSKNHNLNKLIFIQMFLKKILYLNEIQIILSHKIFIFIVFFFFFLVVIKKKNVKIQNSLPKFHYFSFQLSKFVFCYFNPISYNHSQFNPPLRVRQMLPLTYLIFISYFFKMLIKRTRN